MDNSNNNKRIAKNTVALYLRMGITMLVSLYTSRVVLNTLGIEDFGIYNLVGGVIVLFSFLSSSLNGAIQRYLTFELGKNNISQFNRVFNVSLLSLTGVSVILFLLFETIGVWFINYKLVIDGSRLFAANIVFQLSLFSFLININTTPYNSAIIAYEKMSIFAYVGILGTFLKLFAVLLLPVLPYDKLVTYSVLILLVTFSISLINILYCRKKLPGTTFYYIYDKSLLIKLFSFSGWSLMGSISNILSNQGINILFNLFHGVVLNAAFAISNQVSSSVWQFVSSFQTAFSPQITKFYARNDVTDLYKLIYRSSRLSFFLLLIVLFPITLSIDNILSIWLNIVPAYTNQFSVIILGVMLIDTISGPLWMLINATGDIKKYQFYISAIASLNIIFVYLLLYMGVSPALALLSRLLVSILLLISRLIILKQKVDFKTKPFFNEVLAPLIWVTFCVAIIGIPIYAFEISNIWISVLVKTMLAFTLSIPIIFFIGLNIEERRFCIIYIKDKTSNS